jgi:3-oxoacyl-[acyl-carrier protein] reductase
MSELRRVALISGASRGIGAATAREMGSRGYHVVVNYLRNSEAAKGVVDDIKAAGGTAEAQRADVCDGDQVDKMIRRVRDEHGHIDTLICNANTVNPPFEPLLSLSWDSFIGKISGELAGAFFLTQAALPSMVRQRNGRIVYISSTAADTLGSVAAHSTAKAALNTFSRHVAATAAQYGIVVNTVALATVRTDATAKVLNDDLRKFIEERSVSGTMLDPEDAARTVATVADEGFNTAVGQIIRADGGFDVLDQQLHPIMRHFQ